jgi:hypothetical protein
MNGIFVFVVCGAAEHIESLHFSMSALKRFSQHEIIVLTDKSRNEIPIRHENVIDIKTPANYTHHQASIWLKTGIHKFLPKGKLYCYLDTDVVAINNQVDDIFSYRNGVINFATDHCKVRKFSPHAVNCTCLKKNERLREELHAILLKYNYNLSITDPGLLEKRRMLIKKFDVLKRNRLGYSFIALRFAFTLSKFKLDEDTWFLRWKKVWVDKEGRAFLFGQDKNINKRIRKDTGWTWDKLNEKWISPEGIDPNLSECDHLAGAIETKFGIHVGIPNWQHWNGGVFLFDENSHAFLESWHTKTLAIFEDNFWKTRDQGTLIATAWQFGLQDLKTLPIEFNFLADYNHETLEYHQNFTFSFGNQDKEIKPCFLHIYHHWGNKEWDVWRDVSAHILD